VGNNSSLSTEIEEYDVIICGGGPGGSTCALAFKDSGLRVAVIEKSSFPRAKVCGDAFAPYIVKALDKISPEYGNALRTFKHPFQTSKLSVTSYNGTQRTFEFPESFFVASRYEFDNFLYELASKLPNVTYFQNSQVNQVSTNENWAEVTTKQGQVFRANLVIGCDGATSLVRRSLTDFKVNPELNLPAVRAYFEGVSGVESDTLEVYFNKKFPVGYLWVFPSHDGNANVGFGIPSDVAVQQKVNLREELLTLIEESPLLKERFKNAKLVGDIGGWTIPFGYNSYPISGNRFMLVGDAASIADPLSGEGIGLAVVSGRIAAFHAIKCSKKKDFTADYMKGYDKDMEKKFGSLLRRREFFSNLIGKYPWVLDTLVSIGGSPKWLSKPFLSAIMKMGQ